MQELQDYANGPEVEAEPINRGHPHLTEAGWKSPVLDMYTREDLRYRGWTRAQINALIPDRVIQPTKTNRLLVPHRLWDRQRVTEIEQQPEWKARRDELDASISQFGVDQAAARAQRLFLAREALRTVAVWRAANVNGGPLPEE